MALITRTSQRIDLATRDRLRHSLKENADRIEKEIQARRAATPAAASR